MNVEFSIYTRILIIFWGILWNYLSKNGLREQNISDDARLLFDESIMCYRVEAYRAAYLMSYLGFFKELKERLIRSEVPELMKKEEGVWDNLKKRLMDEKKWEEAVMQATQMKTETNDYEESKSKVFLISSDIIEDIQFWRRRKEMNVHMPKIPILDTVM